MQCNSGIVGAYLLDSGLNKASLAFPGMAAALLAILMFLCYASLVPLNIMVAREFHHKENTTTSDFFVHIAGLHSRQMYVLLTTQSAQVQCNCPAPLAF